MVAWVLIFFFCGMGFILTSQENGVCPKKGRVECCVDFWKLQNGSCEACPMGLYGINCSQTCPTGFYGNRCILRCNCSTSQVCTPGQGCVSLPGNKDIATKDNSTDSQEQDSLRNQNPVPENAPMGGFPVPMAVFVIILSLALTVVVILFIARQMMSRGRGARFGGFNDDRSTQGNAELLASTTSGQGEESTYSEIRVSKMLVATDEGTHSKQYCDRPRDARSSNHYSQFRTRKSNTYDKLSLRKNAQGHATLNPQDDTSCVPEHDQYVTLSDTANDAIGVTSHSIEIPKSVEVTNAEIFEPRNNCENREKYEHETNERDQVKVIRENCTDRSSADEITVQENGDIVKFSEEFRQSNTMDVGEEYSNTAGETEGDYYTLKKEYST